MVSLVTQEWVIGTWGQVSVKKQILLWSRHELNQNCQKIILYSFHTGVSVLKLLPLSSARTSAPYSSTGRWRFCMHLNDQSPRHYHVTYHSAAFLSLIPRCVHSRSSRFLRSFPVLRLVIFASVRCFQFVNQEMFWVISEVCRETNIMKRMKIIKNFIRVASRCRHCASCT